MGERRAGLIVVAVSAVAGAVLVVAGLWWAYPPSALVAVGSGLLAVALRWEFTDDENEGY